MTTSLCLEVVKFTTDNPSLQSQAFASIRKIPAKVDMENFLFDYSSGDVAWNTILLAVYEKIGKGLLGKQTNSKQNTNDAGSFDTGKADLSEANKSTPSKTSSIGETKPSEENYHVPGMWLSSYNDSASSSAEYPRKKEIGSSDSPFGRTASIDRDDSVLDRTSAYSPEFHFQTVGKTPSTCAQM